MKFRRVDKFGARLREFVIHFIKKVVKVIRFFPGAVWTLKLIARPLRQIPFIQNIFSLIYEKRIKSHTPEPPIYFLGEQLLSHEEWRRRFARSTEETPLTMLQKPHNTNGLNSRANSLIGPKISVLISLFDSDEYLNLLLSSLQSQTIKENAEFIFILVQPSGYTNALVKEFTASVPYSQIIHHSDRIGIYAAWNEGAKVANSEILTNWNADDTRAPDSLEIQYNYLQFHPWIDVVYQDVYYSLASNVAWEILQAIGMRSNLPNVSARYLLDTGMNPPHNAPAWRRRLHQDYGYFDESYSSAGDYEFWVRIALQDRCFFKVQKPHAAYFINPKGVSTMPGNRGPEETVRIIEHYLPVLNQKTAECQGRLQDFISTKIDQDPDQITEKFIEQFSRLS